MKILNLKEETKKLVSESGTVLDLSLTNPNEIIDFTEQSKNKNVVNDLKGFYLYSTADKPEDVPNGLISRVVDKSSDEVIVVKDEYKIPAHKQNDVVMVDYEKIFDEVIQEGSFDTDILQDEDWVDDYTFSEDNIFPTLIMGIRYKINRNGSNDKWPDHHSIQYVGKTMGERERPDMFNLFDSSAVCYGNIDEFIQYNYNDVYSELGMLMAAYKDLDLGYVNRNGFGIFQAYNRSMERDFFGKFKAMVDKYTRYANNQTERDAIEMYLSYNMTLLDDDYDAQQITYWSNYDGDKKIRDLYNKYDLSLSDDYDLREQFDWQDSLSRHRIDAIIHLTEMFDEDRACKLVDMMTSDIVNAKNKF